jgi:hypothetical protein
MCINIPNASRNIFLKKFFRNNKNWPSYDGLKKKALQIRRKYGIDKNMNEMIIDNRYFDTLYRNLSFKEKSFDNENIFISKEIDILRSNVYSDLIKNYSEINII